MRIVLAVGVFTAVTTFGTTVSAQQFSFEREFPLTETITLDVSTVRGKVEVLAASGGRARVSGVAAVRVGWDVPQDAVELARRVAASPPVALEGSALRLSVPTDRPTQRGVTVSYRVQVPRDTVVISVSESGETVVHGIAGRVDVRTQSAAVSLQGLAGDTRVTTGSGDVSVRSQSGPLSVATASSRFTGSELGSSLRVQTQSGEVVAAFSGAGDAQVETGSSAIRLSNLRGALRAKTQSGRVILSGSPARDWDVSTGSSSVEIQLSPGAAFALDAVTRSSSIVVEGADVHGSREKRAVTGTVNGGGPAVRLRTGNGSIRIQQAGSIGRR